MADRKNLIFLQIIFLALVGLVLSACQTIATDEDTTELSQEEYDQNQIELLVDAMALPNRNVDVICRRLIENYSEKAIPELSQNIENRIPIVRLLSMFCLGQIYTRTQNGDILALRPRFQAALIDPVPRIRLEAAATLCNLGDYRGVGLLIDALHDETPYVRMVASQILFLTFNETFGYQYLDETPQRDIAAKRWEDWWRTNKGQYLQKQAS